MNGTGRIAWWADRILTILWMLMGLVFLAGLCLQIRALLPMPTRLTTWENAPLDMAWQVRRGAPLYTDWRTGPVRIGVYGPAYYWVLGTFGRLADLDRMAMLRAGRWLSVVAFGASLAVLGVMATGPGARRWPWALPLVALGLLPSASAIFLASTRPDTIALLLSLIGLFLAMRGTRWTNPAAAAAMALAVFCKPTAVAAPLAVMLILPWATDRRRLLWLPGMVTAGVLAGFLALQWATGGLFWLHQQVTLAAPRRWGYVLELVAGRRAENQPRLLGAMVGIVLLTYHVRPRFEGLPEPLRRTWRWATAYFVAAMLVAALTARRQGSGLNYLLEPTLAAGWLFALWGRAVSCTADRRSRIAGRAIAWVLLLNPAVFYVDARVTSARQIAEIGHLLGGDYTGGTRRLREAPKPVLCLDPWLAYVAGVDGQLNDPIAFGGLCMNRPGQDVLTESVCRRGFASVVMIGRVDEPRAPIHQDIEHLWPALKAALIENYELADQFDGWCRYAPKTTD